MRVLVCGSRGYAEPETVRKALAGLLKAAGSLTVIEGCARGADRAACTFEAEGVEHEHFPADWDRFGRSAGYRRNEAMARAEPELVLAFVDRPLSESKGTAHMVGTARRLGVPVAVWPQHLDQ